MKLSDLTGEVKISSHHAQTFVNLWFTPEDKICVVGRKSEKTGNLDTVSQSMMAKEFLELDDESLESLIFDEDGNKWNLYFGVCPIKEDVSLRKRGTEENISHVPGVWADIDVKPNGFTSQQEILEFLFSLTLHPTAVIGSGSGGIHAYWKLSEGQTGDRDLTEMWWSYLDETAGDKAIDKLVDLTRILRIPGTVYFPKEGSGSKVGAVEILYLTGYTYSTREIIETSMESFKAKKDRRVTLINKEANRRMEMDGLARTLLADMGGNQWRMWRAISEIEDFVNDNISWNEILEPYGWTDLRRVNSRDGSRQFARPGRKEKSAVVDFEGSPVMSLLSTSEETGLSDLLDARIPITKYRALLRLKYNDQEETMVMDLAGSILNYLKNK